MSEEFIPYRELTHEEVFLLRCLLREGGNDLEKRVANQQLKAIPMSDGGMGSISLINVNEIKENRRFKSKASEIEFVDADGILVSVALLLDQYGDPLELDFFKSDFSSVVSFPQNKK